MLDKTTDRANRHRGGSASLARARSSARSRSRDERRAERRCSARTATGATCWRSPGRSRRSTAAARSRASCNARAEKVAPKNFSLDPGPHRAAPGHARRHQVHRGVLRLRDRGRARRGRVAPDDGWQRRHQGLDAAHHAGGAQGARGAHRQGAADRPILLARFPRAELARPAQVRPRPTRSAIPTCWWSAAGRRASPSRRGSARSASTR